MIFASILLLAACSSDPLDPGAGDQGGGGTNTLLVEGRANAEPRFANARAATDFDTEFSVRVSLNNVAVTAGTVTISSRFAEVPLTWHADPGRWEGRLANYDEVYRLDVVSGPDEVSGVIVDGPDIHTFKAPLAGATLDSTVQNPLEWDRDQVADVATFDAQEIDRITISDTGSFMMGIGVLKAEKDVARENTIELTRMNHIPPSGAVAGSDFAVTITNRLDVIVAPNPAL
ncbi:MAG TPA: hypothetical protein VIV40_03235 [Kofleriaceae bacterium]